MGNVMGNTSQLEKDVENEEWLKDLQENRTLDFSRKVNHSQFLKVYNDTFLLIHCFAPCVESNRFIVSLNYYVSIM